ncbi:MAG: hypothetical protein ABID64_00240 [Nitrospirota bacterium]
MTEPQIGPPKVTFLRFLMKLGAGIGGGVAGALILIVFFMLTASVLQPALQKSAEIDINPIFVFLVMAMMFLASCGANILGTLFLGLTDRERYIKLSSSIYQIFLINIVIFALTAPIYLMTANLGVGMMAFPAGLQIMLGAMASVLILEMVSDPKYSLLGVYSTIFAIFFASGLLFMIYQATEQINTLLFGVLPIVWTSIGFMAGLIGMIYHGVYSTWGVDFLSQTVSYGDDYGEKDEEPTEEEIVEAEDEEGADFLRKE